MTLKSLTDYLTHPERLSADTLPEIEQLVNLFPYSAPLVFLYLYNLAIVKDVRYTAELERWALFLPDRALLYGLVETKMPMPKKELGEPTQDEGHFAYIDRFLEQQGDTVAPDNTDLLLSKEAVHTDYLAMAGLTEQSDELIPVAEEEIILKQTTFPQKETNDEEVPDEEPPLFTEILAKIYVSQGRYDKALTAYKALNAKHPEKSVYFADQIRFIERLIENKEETENNK
ncbi:hypothetical protein Tsumi_12010 [Porphyromonas miyakawae]|uniref:Tetratricopeptide repeat protein n=1 Tax=Porphyromonas miyakawae TaxID=3137470 RepID=A0ABQ0E302_9PORP